MESTVDLRISLPGQDFTITREYTSSQTVGAGWLLGEGWTLSIFNAIRIDSGGPGGTDQVMLRGTPINSTTVFQLVAGSSPSRWSPSPRSEEYFSQAELTTNCLNVATNDYEDLTFDVWRLTYPGTTQVDFYRAGEGTPSELEGLIAQERDMYGNVRTYDYQLVGPISGTRTARLVRIRCYSADVTPSGTPIAEVYLNWWTTPEVAAINNRARFGRLASMTAVRFDHRVDGDYVVPTNSVQYSYFRADPVTDDSTVMIPATDNSVGTTGDLVQVRYADTVDPNNAYSGRNQRIRFTQYRYHGGGAAELNGVSIGGGNHQLKAVIGSQAIEYAAQSVAPSTIDIDWLDTFAYDLLTMADSEVITDFESGRPVVDLAAKVVSYNTSGTYDGRVKTQYLQNGCGCGGSAQTKRLSYTYYNYNVGIGTNNGLSCKVVTEYPSASGYAPLRTEYYDYKLLSSLSGPYLTDQAIVSNIPGLAQRWVTHYDYSDTHRNLTRIVTPSAVEHYYAVDEVGGLSSGFRPSTAVSLRGSAGLVQHFSYSPHNWLIERAVSKGVSGPHSPIFQATYPSSPGANERVWLPTKMDLLTDSTSTSEDKKQTTTLSYRFHAGDAIAAVQWVVEAETNDEGGPGGGLSAYCLFDGNGQIRWIRDNDGALTYRGLDPASGEAVLLVKNANPSGSSGLYPALSGSAYGVTVDSSWGRFSSGGDLTWTFALDSQGRRTRATGPDGASTFTRRIMQPDDTRGGNLLYYTIVSLPPQLPAVGLGATKAAAPASITWLDSAGSNLRESEFLLADGYDPAAGSYALTATETSRSTATMNLGGRVVTERWWHDIGNNGYYATTYEYDGAGRIAYVTDPNGTIAHVPGNELDPENNPLNGYDALGRILIREIGTSKSPSNFTRVAEYYYDDTDGDSVPEQGIGNGNLTHVREFTGEGSSGLSPAARTSSYTYNFRDELIRINGPVSPVTELDYDNLGRVSRFGVFQGSPTGDEPSSLRSTTSTSRGTYLELSYSQRGLLFRTAVAVNPSNLAAGFLERRSWFDSAGRAIESWSPGRAAVKRTFDGLGRATSIFTTDRSGDTLSGSTAYTEASNRADDVVYEQVNRAFDSAGRLVGTALLRRTHDASTTGDLLATTNKAVTTYTGFVYDAAGRGVASVSYGTNDTGEDVLKSGGTAPTALATVPSRSDSGFAHTLINSVEFGPRGQIESAIDPSGRVTKFRYDDLGRTVATIDNYVSDPTFTFTAGRWHVSGGLTADQNRTTTFVYDGLDQLVLEAAHLPPEGGAERVQATKYVYSYYDVYGSNAVGSASSKTASLAAVNDMLYEMWLPDRTTGEPSSTNKISYSYNALGDIRAVTDQAGTRHVYTRDASGRPTEDRVDQFGTNVDSYVGAIAASYDSLGGLDTIESISASSPTETRDQVRFRYNALRQVSRLYQDNDGKVESDGDDGAPLNNTTLVQYDYDTEVLASGNYSRLVSMTYPSGAVYATAYGDAGTSERRIGRPTAFTLDGSDIVGYSYLGLSTHVVARYPQISVDLDRTMRPDGHRRTTAVKSGVEGQYPGFDHFGRLVRQYWVDSDIDNGGGSFATRPQIFAEEYTYDRASNRTSRKDARPGASLSNRDSRFEYDGLGRLKEDKRGVEGTTFVPGKGSERWTLDLLGNWANFERDLAPSGAGAYGIYNDVTADIHETRTGNRNNEMTGRVPNTNQSSTSLPFNYDPAGNLRSHTTESAGNRTVTHDAWNRMVGVQEAGTSGGVSWFAPLATHRYNGLNWRVSTVNGLSSKREMFYSAAWRLLEEEVGEEGESGVVPERRIEHFWGNRYIDDAAATRVTPYVLDGSSYVEGPQRLYYHLTDAQFSSVAIVDDTGKLVERVSYDSYGRPNHRWPGDFNGDGYQNGSDSFSMLELSEQVIGEEGYVADMDLDRNGLVEPHLDIELFGATLGPVTGISDPNQADNIIGYDGYTYDRSAAWYLARNRWYDPAFGRWIERDPLGYADGYNEYEYVGGDPLTQVDPFGLQGEGPGVGETIGHVFHWRNLPGIAFLPMDPYYQKTTPGAIPKVAPIPKDKFAAEAQRMQRIKANDKSLTPEQRQTIEKVYSEANANANVGESAELGVNQNSSNNDIDNGHTNRVFTNVLQEAHDGTVTVMLEWVTAGLNTRATGAASEVFASGGAIPTSSMPLRFSQDSASRWFQIADGSPVSGRAISEVADLLAAGKMNPAALEVQYVVRGNTRLIVNTRSSLALRQANIPYSKWNLRDVSDNVKIQKDISERLLDNKLGPTGTDVLRITGQGKPASTLRSTTAANPGWVEKGIPCPDPIK